MEKLKMQTANKADENFKKLADMFPNAVTEAIDENGEVVRAIDKDVLMQEINTKVVDGKEERYQFTWPDKKKSVLLANAPINKTLRPCREESVDFDNTENLYIEGDNLEVLKLLQETYLGKIKIIYIDPPYNTGTDSFVYDDNFAQSTDEYIENSGQFDDDGNRMVQNPESNGRFHTDWLNMMFTRLRLAKDLLSDDGVIFISIDDNEVANLSKMCDEIFGVDNAIAVFPRLATKSGKTPLTFMVSHDYVLCYTKSRHDIFVGQAFEDDSYKYSDEYIAERGRYNLKQPLDCNSISYSASLDYPITHEGVTYYPGSDYNKYLERQSNGSYAVIKREKTRKISTIDFISNDYSNDIAKKQLASYKISARFDFPKPVDLIKVLLSTHYDKNALVVDFFSGSATTAEAVFKQNLTDGGNRKFILVQLPEKAQDGTYKNICEIGKERIRRAGQKIRNEQLGIKNKGDNSSLQTPNSSLDTGFRVLKCDSSNMKEVYYNPAEYEPSLFTSLEDNIKEDRTPEDLLFQVMLDLGILLSSKIQVRSEKVGMRNYSYFDVEDGYLIACFDKNIDEEVITAIAKQKPYYFVMRDSSMATDSVATNFEQIFAAYSPDTVRKVL